MKITFINRGDEESRAKISHRTWEDFIERIKYDTKERYLEIMREWYIGMISIENYKHFRKIPQLCYQAELKPGFNDEPLFYKYNGIVALQFSGLRTQMMVDDVKQQVMRVPQTIAAFQGGEGRSVIVLCGVQYPDGGLPDSEQKARIFHAHAYQLAVKTYSPSVIYPVDITLPELTQTYLMPLDPKPLVNEHPTLFILDQPSRMPEDELSEARNKNHMLRRLHGEEKPFSTLDTLRAIEKQVNTLLEPVDVENPFAGCTSFEETEKIEKELEWPRLLEMARKCAQCEVPEEEATVFAIMHYSRFSEQEVRDEMRNAYAACKKPRYSLGMPGNKIAALEAQEFIERRYDLKYNEVKGITEFRPRQSVTFMYKELTSTDLNTICHEAALEGLYAGDGALKRYIYSNHTRKYNPIRDYLDGLPHWDGKDRIRELFERIPSDRKEWIDVACTWFLSMVSHWLRPLQNHANSTAIILIGKQGARKSTFCKNILPPHLSEFYTDSIDFRNDIEAERFLSRFMLINIDEFDKLNENQAAYIKHMFQKTQTAHRELFRENISNHPRYASFIGTTNRYDILTDPTGSRRFLCVEVTGNIPTEIPIEYDQLYAQAVSQINDGVRCFVNDKDEALIKEMNMVFQKETPLEALFFDMFEKPEEGESVKYLRPKDILAVISSNSQYRTAMGDEESLGKILVKNGFDRNRLKTGMGYAVKQK